MMMLLNFILYQMKNSITNNRQTVKEPVFALENSDGEYGYGTFWKYG